MTFRGWPPAAVEFYAGLEADNTRAWWTAHKDAYERDVRRPVLELAAEVEAEFGPLHVFRPHRDVRFSSDKSPYKTHLGAVTEGEGGEAYYVQLSATGLFVASGYYRMARDQLERFRSAVVDDGAGEALVEVVAALEGNGFQVGGEALKTAPRGFPRDHPRVRFLRHKGVTAGRSWPPATWLSTRKALDRITGTWRAAAPMHQWLGQHVGPSREAPPDAW